MGLSRYRDNAHLLRDLPRSPRRPRPPGLGQAMANTLLEANRAAHEARDRGADRLDEATLKQIRNHYLGALARGNTDNQGEHSKLADKARTLITRFRRFEDMILRFAADLSVPFTNYPDAVVMPMSVVRSGSAAGQGGVCAA